MRQLIETARMSLANFNAVRSKFKRNPSLNETIAARELRVVGHDGAALGVMTKEEALKLAREVGLDLVVVSTSSEPPIAKILDWGKYNYQKKKKQQQAHQAQSSKSSSFKQMRFGMKIGEYDLDIKLRKVSKFLEEGCKVKLTIILRGREMEHKDLAFEMANKIISKLDEFGTVDQAPQFSGRQVNMIVKGKGK